MTHGDIKHSALKNMIMILRSHFGSSQLFPALRRTQDFAVSLSLPTAMEAFLHAMAVELGLQQHVAELCVSLNDNELTDPSDLAFLKKFPKDKIKAMMGDNVKDEMLAILHLAIAKSGGAAATVHQVVVAARKDAAASAGGVFGRRAPSPPPSPRGAKRQLGCAAGPGRRAPPSMRECMLVKAGGRLERRAPPRLPGPVGGVPVRRAPPPPSGSGPCHERAPAIAGTLLDIDVAAMNKAIEAAWQFFKNRCASCPRWDELFLDGRIPTEEEIDVIKDMLRDGSRSHKAVQQRTRGAGRFLDEIIQRGFDPWHLTCLQQTSWIRRQMERGPSCPAHAATIVRWLANACGFFLHPLRVAFRLRTGADALVRERAVKAKCPPMHMVKGLAAQITCAPTLALRCYAGLCVLAIECSCGFREANRVRSMKLTAEALVGESRAKNHAQWMPWAAVRAGVCGCDWAPAWITQLAAAGLPGPDFVLNAATRDGTRWLPRVAQHADANSMLGLLLTLPPHSLEAREAASFNFHGLKKLYPTLAIQLKAVGTITDERGVERMGHWAKGSNMQEVYNDEACVAELHTRSVIADAVNDGWTPAAFGCIPATPTSRATASSAPPARRLPLAVSFHKSVKIHIVDEPPWTSCRRYRCGYPEDDVKIKFMNIGEVKADAKWCMTCEARMMGRGGVSGAVGAGS